MISCSADKTIKKWELVTCSCVKTLVGHNNIVTAIKVRDNDLFSSCNSGAIKIWNLETGECSKTILAHPEKDITDLLLM